MLIFAQQVWAVAWSIFNMSIPLGSGIVITPWQIALGTAVIALLLRYLIREGQNT